MAGAEAAAYSDHSAAGFELCLGATGPASGSSDGIPVGHDSGQHCLYCFTGAHHAFVAPAQPRSLVSAIASDTLRPSVHLPEAPRFKHPALPPRGPPQQA
ncbi:MAG: DUF2946 family protein [Xanthobacteraceae bacterium]